MTVVPAGDGGEVAVEQLIDRLWRLGPAEADLEAAQRRSYDAAVAIMLGPRVQLWDTARQVLRGLWPGACGGAAVAATLAACCRITEVDDIHLRSCTTPGAIVIPVALGLATLGVPKAALLRGIVIGYEAVTGAAEALGGPYALRRGIWPTRAVAPVAAAVAAAAMLGLGEEQAADAAALGASASLAGSAPEPARELSLGYAVMVGVAGAISAAAGVAGDRGLLRRWTALATAGAQVTPLEPGPDPELAIHETCVKPFCSARQSLAATAAVRAVAATEQLTAGEVLRVEAGVPSAHAAMVDRLQIASRLDAIASLQYQIVMALHCPDMLDDIDRSGRHPAAGLADLMQRVSVHADPELDRHFPGHWGARVQVITSAGSYSLALDGVPSERAAGWPELEEKAARLFGRAHVEEAEARSLKDQVLGPDVAGLARRLSRLALPDEQGPAEQGPDAQGRGN
jgi:2-methylcitrate dehydratase PrpD